ncbi:MAG: LVIVD repeat-containing protein [Thermoplasmatota archaeon]
MRFLLAVGLLTVVGLAGCIGDDDADADELPAPRAADDLDLPYWDSHPEFGYATYGADGEGLPDAWLPPAHRGLPDELGALAHLTHVPGLGLAAGLVGQSDSGGGGGGAGIAVFGHHAYVGATGGPLNVVDISDPADPEVVGSLDVPMRDAETIAYPDGRLILVSTAGGGTVYVTDVTDPTAPALLVEIEMAYTSHNLAVLPGTPILYNSPSSGVATDIWDLSDPEQPILALDWENGAGCHDIMWYLNATEGKFRGYCAGIGVTQVWDITDALDPKVISEIGLPDSTPLSISHLAMVNHDATVLVVGDETGGGGAPACDYYLENPVTGETQSGPSGNLWFYDLADETAPQYVSRLSVAAYHSHATCTSHFGRIIEQTNHLAMSFYGAGVILVDFNDVANPRIVDQWRPIGLDAAGPGITWDVWYYQGYLFTGDIQRGMDVLTIEAPLLPVA